MSHPDRSAVEAQQVFDYIMRRATTDRTFRNALLEYPRETLEAELDVYLSVDFSIQFVENNGADLTLVLPDMIDNAESG